MASTQRVCHESEKTEVQGTEMRCPFSTADNDNYLLFGCKVAQRLPWTAVSVSEIPTQVSETPLGSQRQERELRNSLFLEERAQNKWAYTMPRLQCHFPLQLKIKKQ